VHLFGDSGGPHLAHFHARRERDYVELIWEVRNAPDLSWRILRSEHEFAATADAFAGSGQILVMQGTETHARDDRVAEGTPYFYTVFAQDEQGVWQRQVTTRLEQPGHLHWHHGDDASGAGVVYGPAEARALAMAAYPSGMRR
jgi:hypothetical protein